MRKIRFAKHDAISDNFPHTCMICTKNEVNQAVFHKFTYYPIWVYIGLLLAFIPGVILAFIGKKEGNANLQMCAECHERWKVLPSWGCLIFLAEAMLFAGMIAALLWKPTQPLNLYLALFLFLMSTIVPLVYHFAWRKKYTIKATYIDEGSIELEFPSEKYPEIYDEHYRSKQKHARYT